MDAKSLQPGNGYQLPPEAYYSQEWFEREQKDLFSAAWNFACTTDALVQPGNYVSIQIGHYPIVLVCGEDEVIRGFHNSCRHRGARITDDRGTCKTLVCPYHRWQYALDGSGPPECPGPPSAVDPTGCKVKSGSSMVVAR